MRKTIKIVFENEELNKKKISKSKHSLKKRV